MACLAARKAALRELPIAPAGGDNWRTRLDGMSASQTWQRIRWWTPETIEEALEESVTSGEVVAATENEQRLYWRSTSSPLQPVNFKSKRHGRS